MGALAQIKPALRIIQGDRIAVPTSFHSGPSLFVREPRAFPEGWPAATAVGASDRTAAAGQEAP